MYLTTLNIQDKREKKNSNWKLNADTVFHPLVKIKPLSFYSNIVKGTTCPQWRQCQWIKTRNSLGILLTVMKIFSISFFLNKKASDSECLHALVYKREEFKFPICKKLLKKKRKKRNLNSAGSIKTCPGGLKRSSFSYLRVMDTMWGTPGPTDKAAGRMKRRKEEVAYLCFPKIWHPEIICCILR